jgi:hypothetical protein
MCDMHVSARRQLCIVPLQCGAVQHCARNASLQQQLYLLPVCALLSSRSATSSCAVCSNVLRVDMPKKLLTCYTAGVALYTPDVLNSVHLDEEVPLVSVISESFIAVPPAV